MFMKGKRIIELGSGTGLLGIVLAKLGCESCVVSDLHTALSLCSRNVESNKSGQFEEDKVFVRQLNWGNNQDIDKILTEFSGFDCIVGTDIVYHQEEYVLNALAATVISLSSESTVFMLAYEERDGMIEDEGSFFSRIRPFYRSIQLIDIDPNDPTRYLYIFSQFSR